jgi:hypothetical protein
MSNSVPALQGMTAAEFKELRECQHDLDECIAWFDMWRSPYWDIKRCEMAELAKGAYNRKREIRREIERRTGRPFDETDLNTEQKPEQE